MMPCFITSKSSPSFFLLLFFCLFLFLFSASTFSNARVTDGVGEKEVKTMKSMLEAKKNANMSLVLAKERTRRRDFFNHFNLYTGGWNISDSDYITSVLSTAVPFFAVAVAWFVVFALFLFICACYCCCNGEPNDYSKTLHHFSCILLILCTIAAIGGCAVLYAGQYKFHESTSNTLDYVVSQAQFVAENLRNVSSSFDSAKQLVVGFPVPLDLGSDLAGLNKKVTTAARSISEKTHDNSKIIRHVIDGVRLALVIVVAVMLFVTFVRFLFSLLGWQCPVYFLALIGWILVTGTLLLCGAFLFVHNVSGDACVAMDEWVVNPTAHTALDDILPCVESETAVEALLRSKAVAQTVIQVFDTVISNVTNGKFIANYNQSGPLVPLLCNPFNSDFTPRQCAPGEVTFDKATEVWKNYTCEVNSSSSEECRSEGRLTPSIYKNLASAVNVTYGLLHYGPFLIELVDCSFARKAFAEISSDYCPALRRYTEWVYLGSLVLSAAVMLSLIFWIVFVREQWQLLHPFAY